MKFGRICASAMLLAVACTAAPEREAPREQVDPERREPETEPKPEPIFKSEPDFEGRGLPLIATGIDDLAAVCELLRTRECPKSDDCNCSAEISLGAEVVVARVTGEAVLQRYEQTPEALALPAGTHPLVELLEPTPEKQKARLD